eukprot:7813448-Pyramimonas_sp.AAC.1
MSCLSVGGRARCGGPTDPLGRAAPRVPGPSWKGWKESSRPGGTASAVPRRPMWAALGLRRFSGKKLAWSPSKKRTHKDPEARAWAAMQGRAKHLGKMHQHLSSEIKHLQELDCPPPLAPIQYSKLLQSLRELPQCMANVARRKKVLACLDIHTLEFFSSGFSIMARPD